MEENFVMTRREEVVTYDICMDLMKLPYDKLNTMLGSLEIEEMQTMTLRLRKHLQKVGVITIFSEEEIEEL